MTTLWVRLAIAATLASVIPVAPGMALTAQSQGQSAVLQAASPVARHVEQALVRGSGAIERSFYASRGYAPVWLAPDGSATEGARALLDWVGEADAHALPSRRYDASGLAARLGGAPTPREAGALEIELTRLFVRYAGDLSSGALEPRSISRQIDVTPPRPDLARLLERVAGASDIRGFLDGIAPSDPAYDRLLELRREMRRIVREGGWGPAIADGPTLRLGDRSPRVAQIRDRLIALGDLPTEEQVASNEVMNDSAMSGGDPMVLDPALEAAVLRFQARHGLNTDGAVGPNTLAALNVPAEQRAEQVAINLERLRWLNRELGRRHVIINTAAFSMSFFEDGARRFTTRTVVGKAGRFATPEFNDELEHIVVNPSWNVPRSIATQEILPELRQDPYYLEKNNMELVGADMPATQIDWSTITPGSFPWRVRQRPGPQNALGAVKFLFPNKYAIYMHDTPAKRLFARDERDFSHGCVRLEKPFEFAHLLLSYQTANPAGTFERLRARHGEQWVTLEQTVPVYVTYRTAWVAEDGAWQFRGDIYRRDAEVAAALREAGVSTIGG